MDGKVQELVQALQRLRNEITFDKGRDWQLDLGPYAGKKSEMKTLETPMASLFFVAQKPLVTDTAPESGTGTRVHAVFVGLHMQWPFSIQNTKDGRTDPLLTRDFANPQISNLKLDTLLPWEKISMTVEFVEDCTFMATFFGKAVHL